MSDTVKAYDLQAAAFAARYESVPADAVHGPLLEFIPQGRDLIALDVGAGSVATLPGWRRSAMRWSRRSQPQACDRRRSAFTPTPASAGSTIACPIWPAPTGWGLPSTSFC